MNRSTILPARDFKSTFLSCEKDCEEILKRIFVTSNPYSEDLKRLLVINTKDCLDNKTSQVYADAIVDKSLSKLVEEGYIRLVPKISMDEHNEVQSYIVVSFDNFYPSTNLEFRDHTISFDILCHTEYWDLGNFRVRPLKIAGYIDGILNRARLTGIGQLNFVSCKELLLDETLAGYTLTYIAYNGSDDEIENG